ASLARAREQSVLAAWSGLGYYARARNLHRAAREIVRRHGGRLPDDPRALRELPGFGEYTAAAVASLAFGRSVPAAEANVTRALARLRAPGHDGRPRAQRGSPAAGGRMAARRPGRRPACPATWRPYSGADGSGPARLPSPQARVSRLSDRRRLPGAPERIRRA